MQIGSCVNGYEYVEGEYKEIIHYYPLFYNNNLIAFTLSLDGTHYQLETKLAKEINKINIRKCALIYAAEGCYLYDGISFNLLMIYDIPNNHRMCLNREIENAEIELCDLHQKEELRYVQTPRARIQTYYSCNVPYVSQLPYNKICWAATIATVSNYLNGTNYTAEQIAKAYYGDNFNDYVSIQTLASLMSNNYNLDYTYQACLLGSTVIYNNIVNGYPVVGSCIYRKGSVVEGAHAITIFGVNIVSGYIVLMDPSMGSLTVYASGTEAYTYSYWNSCFGKTMELESGICHSWGG